MKHLFFCWLILAYMHALAQTDTVDNKNTLPSLAIKTHAIKYPPAFSHQMRNAYRLTDPSNRLYILSRYRPMFHYDKHNNRQNAWQIAGYTLISIFAHKNQHIYNYSRPKK